MYEQFSNILLLEETKSVESNSLGSVFVAMKQLYEHFRSLRCHLQIMSATCKGPTFTHGENQSALCGTSTPEPTLKKKNQSITCHIVYEGISRDEWKNAC